MNGSLTLGGNLALRRSASLCLALLLSLPLAARAGDRGEEEHGHGDILVQQDGFGQLITGIAEFPRDPEAEEIGVRIFEAELDATGYAAEPGFLSFADELPDGAFDLPDGALSFDMLSFPLTTAESRNLWYWNGEGEPSFGPAPAGHKLALFLGAATATADGADVLVPGFTIGNTSPLLHQDLNTQLLDAAHNDSLDLAGLVDNTPEHGVYVLTLQARQDGLTSSEPFWILLGHGPDDETIEAWIESAEGYIEGKHVPEPATAFLAAMALAAAAITRRRR